MEGGFALSREDEKTTMTTTRASSSSTNASISVTTPWLKSKDPRIVRVSRAFGGKDRHSKVLTVRGLRDRRVRLSVPTAIQLYDLQERLGLNQPSKVVDWLLHVAKDEINELPPIEIPPVDLMQIQRPFSWHESNISVDHHGLQDEGAYTSLKSNKNEDGSLSNVFSRSNYDMFNSGSYNCQLDPSKFMFSQIGSNSQQILNQGMHGDNSLEFHDPFTHVKRI